MNSYNTTIIKFIFSLFLLFQVGHFIITPEYCGINPDFGLNYNPTPPPLGTSLGNLQLVMRHGDRSSIFECPNSVNPRIKCDLLVQERVFSPSNGLKGNKFFIKHVLNEKDMQVSCTTGQLTLHGYFQAAANGKFIRSFYIDQLGFLSDILDVSQFRLQSTNIYRTIQSAQGLISGIWPDNIFGYEYIDIYTMESNDFLIPYSGTCKLLNYYKTQVFGSIQYRSFVRDTKYLLEKYSVSNTSGGFFTLFDCLSVSLCHHSDHVDVSVDDYNLLTSTVSSFYNLLFSYPNKFENSKLNSGRLISRLFNNIESYLNGNSNTRFNIYSAHDITIVSLLNSLGVWDKKIPPYASTVFVELWVSETGDANFVHIVYNGKEVVLPECGNPYCPLSIFREIIAPLMLNDEQYTEICNSLE